MRFFTFIFIICFLTANYTYSQENTNKNKFRQLKEELATPNVYRTASGAPGHEYWQQKADYKMDIKLDDKQQRIYGEETVTYYNQSPDALDYVWMQLDQNIRAKDSDTKTTSTSKLSDRMSTNQLERLIKNDFDGGFKLDYVKDEKGNPLHYAINKTMMRVDLPEPLLPGETLQFSIKWWYNINNMKEDHGRSGYEHFEEDGNNIYTIAQFYPRMAVYNDVDGWQHRQFLGTGEFTLPFGDFEVRITSPADHVVGATGILQNPDEVLTPNQQDLLKKAEKATKPVIIVSQKEAEKAEKENSKKEKTWVFKAQNVRDFAFASSRKFIWDAMGVKFGDRTVMAMSYYPKEGNPLWEQYSTQVVAHTIKSYSKHTFDYPYPVAISVSNNYVGGMEYPMICFNSTRPQPDGTYSERAKNSLIGVIIHEVGHNFFPMIVNSDERQWTWMDEGLNTFMEFLSEQEWEYGFPSRAGQAYKIVDYMKGDKKYMSPIMTNSESVWNLGSNAYSKPTTALNILRETVMGRELFDFAFKEYANRWKFKHPTPEDFFRTMEDASGVDLDWFWRGWFYTTDNVDIALDKVTWLQPNSQKPEVEKAREKNEEKIAITDIRNKEEIQNTTVEQDPATHDFYTTFDKYKVTKEDKEYYDKLLSEFTNEEKDMLNGKYNFYQIDLKNIGGLVMPVILQFTFTDGSTEVQRIPAEIWRRDNEEVSKVFVFEKEVSQITLDPFYETADVDMNNNYWPPKLEPTRFEIFKSKHGARGENSSNPMQQSRSEK